ncbi:MAG: endonuclease/exonuclease/phosphatase family protein [Spirochaetia bacterium]
MQEKRFFKLPPVLTTFFLTFFLFIIPFIVPGTPAFSQAANREAAPFSTALTTLPPEELVTEDRAVLATWNIRIFSDNSRDEDELLQICMILSRFDFIALQELRDTAVLDRALVHLEQTFGRTYEYVVGPEVGRGVKERYGFLFDIERVEYTGKSFKIRDPDDLFIREPFLASFRTGEFDFYAINMHSIYGDSVSGRRAEALLLDDVFLSVQALDDEQDILLFGDFNLSPEDKGFDELWDVEGMRAVNRTMPTTIYGSIYDTIWYQEQYLSEASGYFGIYPFDEAIFDNDDKLASLVVSDHRPLWILVDISGPDDD